ncbi:hypothetical protein OQH61_01505 [Helicobacter sp. MIT 21-1697]|uniref:hypothetical protein n=1 Tax=Helicobacter sp. MIT 21-1697 TaxID=2993733 RepID=UPI00224B1CE6|nr:hypothetical protein [Helicobacter sp. MIT 21-1697]MCX2716414.1 hypothetical protein [Helicobacter sp. MIT 21-1697]
MIERYLFVAFIPLLFYANEPSAFEKQSGVTKNDIKTLQSLITHLQQKVDTIQQAQEGVSSLYESQSSKLQQQVIQTTQQAKNIEELNELYKNLKQKVDENTQEIKMLTTQIQEINKSLSTLNEAILDGLKQLNNTPANQTTKNTTNKPTFLKDKNKKSEIFTQAQEMFKKSEYESAKERFEWLLEIDYKKADSHFYLGEIAFADKSYNTAIYHYKESAMANDKTKYMPTLLLHTAQSFNAIKDIKNYNKFLDSLIGNYPSSKEAQNAKKLKAQNKEKK